MLFYIAFIAIVNLMLGYALAVYLGATRRAIVVQVPVPAPVDPYEPDPTPAATYHDDHADDNYEPAAAEPDPQAQDEESPLVDPITGLKTRTHFQQILRWRATAADAAETPLTVALLDFELPQVDPSIDDRILRNVANTVHQLISDGQTAVRYSDRQILLLLDNDGFEKASQRAEELRQRIDATEYVAGGDSLRATVACALLETTAAEPEDRLLAQLGEALDEARAQGGNCTYRHDGMSVTPVPALNLGIEPQKCHI